MATIEPGKEKGRPQWLPFLDLRGITRASDKCATIITCRIHHREFTWIHCGSLCELHGRDNSRIKTWIVGAYLNNGATDFEHDSAYAFRFEVLEPKLDMVTYSRTWLTTFINPDPFSVEQFHVPESSDYNPAQLVGAHMCEEDYCEKPHPIVPEGYYVPPTDKKYAERMRGVEIIIRTGPAYDAV